MVTASDGSPTLVTSRPLTSPPRAPTATAMVAATGIESPDWKSSPSSTLLSPTMLPTDRSMSPVMMTAAIGNAMSSTVAMSRKRNVIVMGVANFGTASDATTRTTPSSATIAISRVSSTRRHSGRPYVVVPAPDGAAVRVVMTGASLR